MDFLRPASWEEALAAKAEHPTAVPIAGGTDVMVEIVADLPTTLDTPTIPVDVLELADDHAPYGLRGVGEAPTLSSTPAVLAAVRDATGLGLDRTPVRPEHLTGTA